MYYLLLLATVSLLAILSWRHLSRRQLLAREAALAAAGATTQAVDPARERVAQLLRGPKEDKPCLTPIDCVAANRCDGHCGCH